MKRQEMEAQNPAAGSSDLVLFEFVEKIPNEKIGP
jgi:hypothetical protein